MKLGYLQTLPWALAALGLADEERARAAGLRVRALFRRNPLPPPVQHKKTWELMNPEAPFSIALDRFIDEGCSRRDCGRDFNFEIAKWKFMPDAETIIEEKHARVSHASAKSPNFGKVKVSLANRLPMLERSLARCPSSITSLMDSLALTRSFFQVPELFGFASHPALVSQQKASSQNMAGALADIIYRCDAQGTYQTFRRQGLHNEHATQQKRRAEKKLTEVPRGVGLQGVMENAMRDHFRQTCAEDSFYSIAMAAEPQLEGLQNFMETDGVSHAVASARDKRDDGGGQLLALADDGDLRTQPAHSPPRLAGCFHAP